MAADFPSGADFARKVFASHTLSLLIHIHSTKEPHMMMQLTQRRRFSKIATRQPTPASVEPLEQRQLMSVSLSSGSEITEITGYSLYAEALMGDNGDPWGVAGVASGTAGEEMGYSFQEWDANLANGLDSGLIDFNFTVDLDAGSISWTVGGADTITYSGTFGTGISQVDIRAGVLSSGMAFTFSNLSLSFYNDNSLVDTETPGSIAASTIGAQTSDPAESLAVVTPDASSCDKVIVTGKIRLQAAQGINVGATDIFGQIYIHDAA
jgi:hypothetical protein